MSIFRYFERKENGKGALWWGRAEQDGAPFRGDVLPVLTEDEYDKYVKKGYDVQTIHVRSDQNEELRQLTEILTAAANDLYRVMHMETAFHEGVFHILVVYTEQYMEMNPEKARVLGQSQGIGLPPLETK